MYPTCPHRSHLGPTKAFQAGETGKKTITASSRRGIVFTMGHTTSADSAILPAEAAANRQRLLAAVVTDELFPSSPTAIQ